VLVDKGALEARGLQARDLIQGTRPAALREIAEVLARCNRLLIF
jgi:sulfur relay (sulfurtransferase) complex TusBCD TusD component (DsrE family)